ncbi:MAG TPA: methyltransferase [Xanthobacteraceae bacterium]|nr:methyltransferase [Xanthobacteraceae bacterium]
MGRELSDAALTDDAALGGRLRLRQPARGHRFGHDAILLAAATPAKAGEVAVDLGAGVGAAGLALARRVDGLAVRLVEIDAALARLAADNAARNDLAARVSAHALDVGAPPAAFAAAGLPPQSADRVLMNPPFRAADRAQASPDARRRAAHLAAPGALATWLGTAARLLRPGGTLVLIHHAEALAEVLELLEPAFGGLAIQPVHPKPGAPAIRILVRATQGGRAPLALLPGLVLNGDDGRPTAQADAVLRDAATLPLAQLF